MQFGLGATSRQAFFVVDLVISAIIIFLILRFFNFKRGLAYFLVVFGAIVGLVISANYTLPALHLLSQLILTVLIVGLPLFFEEKWLALFNRGTTNDFPSAPKPRYLNTFWMALISLVVGLLFAAISNGPGVKTAELPQGVAVSATNLKEGISANFGSQKRISVIVQAPRSVWATLKDEDFSASADVKNLEEGTHEVAIMVTSKKSDVKIVRTKPTKVTVTLEPVIRKTVAVVARYVGKAGNDLVPGDPVFDPDKAEITGPKSVVEDVSQAVVEVKLDGLAQNIDQKFRLVALNSSGQVIEDVTFLPVEVAAKVPLVKAGKLKTVGIKVKTTGAPTAGYWVEQLLPTPSTVVVTGSADALDKLTFIETDAVSVSGLSADSEVQITLAFPSGIAAAEPINKVTVKIDLSETNSVKTIAPTITYDGVDASLKVTTINPTSVSVVVSGTNQVLNALNGGDINLKLNLSAYKSAGTYAVTIKNENFVMKEGTALVSFLPSVINVTLELK
ncbi:MAG: hypothetical protein HZB70_01060 [Candidatus Berkelbacteria bacterium]|nr:MAG: hypothetical protein HZB70_01060 [Candidatus Berkelbacteria bacterium]QQG52072.1 MAG: hypothetical protein HY845_01935 [Candidatus Berkelbacteria bacterium]